MIAVGSLPFPFLFFLQFLFALPYASDGQADALEGTPAAELGQQAIHGCSRYLLYLSALYWTGFAFCSTLEVNAGTVP